MRLPCINNDYYDDIDVKYYWAYRQAFHEQNRVLYYNPRDSAAM